MVNDIQYHCGWVSAYKTSTGRFVWRRLYHRTYRAVVVGSTVYVQHDNGSLGDLIDALDLATGKRRWSSESGGDGFYNDYAPAVGAGLVMSSIWAADTKTGTPKLTLDTDGHNTWGQGSTIITGGRIYLNAGDSVAAFDANTGLRLWLKTKSMNEDTRSGAQRPAVHAGRVYVTGQDATLVYDAKTGHQYRSLPGSFSHSPSTAASASSRPTLGRSGT